MPHLLSDRRFAFIICSLLLSLLAISVAVAQEADPQLEAALAALDISDPGFADELALDSSVYAREAAAAYNSGDYSRAAGCYMLALQRAAGDASLLYNLACCQGLLGNAELAGRYLRLSVANGFGDAFGMQHDPDFEKVRDDPGFSQVLTELLAELEMDSKAAGQRIYFPARTWQPAWVRYPENYDPAEPHRLLVCLHGYGSNAEDFMGIRERFSDPDFIMICPRAPYPFSLGAETGYSWAGWTADGGLTLESFADSQAYLDEVIGGMRRTHNISEVYLFGFSQGAMFSVYEGLSSPLLVDGVIIFGGALYDFLIGDGLLRDQPGKLRWYVVHGSRDTQVEFERGQALRDALLEAGHDVSWREFDGAHSVPAEEVKLAEAWMRAQDAEPGE
ncbi:MAG: hypothetical protein R3F46_15670 [bacterium]